MHLSPGVGLVALFEIDTDRLTDRWSRADSKVPEARSQRSEVIGK